MKKLFLLFLFCSIFALGCSKETNNTSFDETESENSISENSINEVNDDNAANKALRIGTEQSDTGNFNAAVDTYTKALEQIKDNANLYVDRARAKIELGDLDGALDDINKGLEVNEEAWLYVERATIYNMKGETELALEDYKKATSLKPNIDFAKDSATDLETQPEEN